jgi:hypothetical protein
MDCDTYCIAPAGDGWQLVLNGRVLASGMEQKSAERAAAVAARMSERRGRKVVVLSENGDEIAWAA